MANTKGSRRLAGVNLHTWTGFGSVPYWNAYLGATEMHGVGTFFDARFNDKDQYPIAAKSGAGNTRGTPDKLTAKLAALHFYQLSIPAPKAPAESYDQRAFERAKTLLALQQLQAGRSVTGNPGGNDVFE